MKAYRKFSQIVTLENAYKKDGRCLLPDDLSIIRDASIVFSEDQILWIGPDNQFPEEYNYIDSSYFEHKILLPEIVDCHTHLVFGGDRSQEYAMRLNGVSYEDLAKAGGGILSTMNGTHATNSKELFEIGKYRIEQIASYGVGTIEIKSGYGLNYDKEYELTNIIHDLKVFFSGRINIFNTFLAAHAIPKEYRNSNEYMDKVVFPLLETLAPMNIIDAVDIFHEQGFFNKYDTTGMFDFAKNLGIPCKSHADEFINNHGAKLAVKYNALSTDHLMKTDDEGIKALAQSKTVATLLPGTSFFLGKEQADARKFLDAGAKVAIGSDYNPGSCHCDNIILIASLAAPQYKMNIGELWSAITLNAAHALGFSDQGALVKGMKPRFSIFNTNDICQITYNWGKNLFFRIDRI